MGTGSRDITTRALLKGETSLQRSKWSIPKFLFFAVSDISNTKYTCFHIVSGKVFLDNINVVRDRLTSSSLNFIKHLNIYSFRYATYGNIALYNR